MRKYLSLLALLLFVIPARASTIAYAPSSAGGNTGVGCANAYSWTDGTNGLNQSLHYVAGNTLELCSGTYPCSAAGATGFTIQASGSSGSPITIQLDSGAVMSCGYWGADPFNFTSAAIVCSGKSYITITGTGTIENTANGTGLANQAKSTGMSVHNCQHFTLSGNISIINIYVSTSPTDTNPSGAALWMQDSDNWSITGATFTEAYQPVTIMFDSGSGITSGVFSNNTVDYGTHLMVLGDNNSGATASGVTISGNTFGPHNDIFSGGGHQDGLFLQAFNGTSTISGFQIYNNYFKSDMCHSLSTGYNCTAPIFYSGAISSTNFFNNIVQITSSVTDPEGLVNFGVNANNSSTGDTFYNNTFDYNGGSCNGQSGTCFGIKLQQASGGTLSGVVIENNVFTGGDNFHAAVGNQTGTAIGSKLTTVDHNLYYNYSNVGYDATTSTTYSFSTWQSSLSFDSHGTTGNPNFNASYIPASGSPAIGLGANLTSLSIPALDSDKNGNVRPASGAWTAGAVNPAAGAQLSAPCAACFVENLWRK